MNCYCTHPEKSHELMGPKEKKPCLHCPCRGFVEQAEKEQAHIHTQECLFSTTYCPELSVRRAVEKIYKEQASDDVAHSEACTDSPLRECNPDCPAKPQEEPSCPGGANCESSYHRPMEEEEPKCENGCPKDEINPDACTCPCHQKESESKEGNPVYVMTEIICQKLKEIYESNIVLPRPKGMSIGEAMWNFYIWLRNSTAFHVGFNDLTDEDFLKLWQEWLTSLKK